MCGILGFVSNSPSTKHYRTLEKLFKASKERGDDATGVCYYETKEDGFFIDKHHVDADDFVKDFLRKRKTAINSSTMVIGHTRAWTHGEPEDNNNNHPIHSEHYIMVHNGHVISTPKIANYPYNGEVDSERILSHIETKGIANGLEDCVGSAALAFIDLRKKHELLLYRETNPIHLAYKPDDPTIWFASTEDILRKALDDLMLGFFSSWSFRSLPENELWKVSLLKDARIGFKKVADVAWGKNRNYASTYGNNHYGHLQGDWDYLEGGGIGTKRTPTTPSHDKDWLEKFSKKPETTRHCGKSGAVSSKILTGSRFTWSNYWSVEDKAMVTVKLFSWKWWPEERVWYHTDIRSIKKYFPERRRCEISSPEHAVNIGWITQQPEPYKKEAK